MLSPFLTLIDDPRSGRITPRLQPIAMVEKTKATAVIISLVDEVGSPLGSAQLMVQHPHGTCLPAGDVRSGLLNELLFRINSSFVLTYYELRKN